MAFGKNGAVYIVCALIGYGISALLPHGAWSVFAYLLITYHLYLGYHVMIAEHEAGFSLPIFSTIITHLACLTLVICFGLGRHHIPFYDMIRLLVPALAPFESEWLFKGQKHRKEKKKAVPVSKEKIEAAEAAVAATVTVDEYQEWLKYLATPNRPPRKPGQTVQDEYKQWILARARSRVVPPQRPQ